MGLIPSLVVGFVVLGILIYLATVYNGLNCPIERHKQGLVKYRCASQTAPRRAPAPGRCLQRLYAIRTGGPADPHGGTDKVCPGHKRRSKTLASGNLSASIQKLFAVAESNPDLKANLSFLELQKRITELESQIADRREFYNDAINLCNTRIQQMPDSMLAGPMGLKPRAMFRVSGEEKAPVNVALTPTQIWAQPA